MTNDANFEARSLELLASVHEELASAIDSLVGKQAAGYVENFKYWSCVYMGHACQGFRYVRRVGGFEESRFFVRPTIEIMLKLRAIERRPDLIYRIGLKEVREDRTWFRELAKQADETFDEARYDQELAKFKTDCMTLFPSGDFNEGRLTLEQIATTAGAELFYNSHYRTYCKFTHATLRVIIGDLNEVAKEEDNPTMIFCAMAAVDAAISLGASVPRRDSLEQQRIELAKERSS